jgi:hypothetical protein
LWYDTICVFTVFYWVWHAFDIITYIEVLVLMIWYYGDMIPLYIVADVTYRCWYWLIVVFIDGIIMIQYGAVCETQADADIVDVVIINYSWYFTSEWWVLPWYFIVMIVDQSVFITCIVEWWWWWWYDAVQYLMDVLLWLIMYSVLLFTTRRPYCALVFALRTWRYYVWYCIDD